MGSKVSPEVDCAAQLVASQSAQLFVSDNSAHAANSGWVIPGLALDHLPLAASIVDLQGRIAYCNDAARALWGRGPEEGQDRWSGAWGLLSGDGTAIMAHETPLARVLQTGAAVAHPEIFIQRPDGSQVPCAPYAAPIRDDQGQLLGALEVLVDVSEQRAAETRLANTDVVTGLPNRRAIDRYLRDVLMGSQGQGVGVFRVDIDKFRDINDVFGASAGDAVLAQTGQRIAQLIGTGYLGRAAGDEFIIILNQNVSSTAALALGDQILKAVAAPFIVDGQTLRVSVSIGAALSPADGTSPETLLKNSDVALARAEAEGRSTMRLFDAERDRKALMRSVLAEDIKQAMAAGQFSLHFQPKVLIDGTLRAYEALLRWHHPLYGPIPPDTFIPLAEESGLIVVLGQWVIDEACRTALSWPAPVRVAVNVSPAQFRFSNLPGDVAASLAKTGLDPARLELEITEGVLFHDFAGASAALHECLALGVSIALDDFGAGYASFSYLHSFPFSKIKLDRGLTRNVVHDQRSRVIVETLVSLCHRLDMRILAEGVETAEQYQVLKAMGCDEAQGFFFGRPAALAHYTPPEQRR